MVEFWRFAVPPLDLTRIKKKAISESVADQLRLAILRGEVAVGERLPPERELAPRFGTNRNTLREAIRLDNRKEYQDLYNKMSAYTRLLKVPGDYSTIGEALSAARPNDKIRLAEGTFSESLTLNVRVDLEGAGVGKSIIECDAASASVLLATKEASGSRVAAVTMRQTGISLAAERFGRWHALALFEQRLRPCDAYAGDSSLISITPQQINHESCVFVHHTFTQAW